MQWTAVIVACYLAVLFRNNFLIDSVREIKLTNRHSSVVSYVITLCRHRPTRSHAAVATNQVYRRIYYLQTINVHGPYAGSLQNMMWQTVDCVT